MLDISVEDFRIILVLCSDTLILNKGLLDISELHLLMRTQRHNLERRDVYLRGLHSHRSMTLAMTTLSGGFQNITS